MLLLLGALAWAVPTKTLEAEVDRRVLLVDPSGRQIDCSLVAVQDERLVVRLDDGSLAAVPRDEVANIVDLGPAPPPPEVIEVVPEEPEDDFGEEALDEGAEDSFDVDEALDELLVDDAAAAVPVEAVEVVEEPVAVAVERAELPDEDEALPEADGWEDPEPVEVVAEVPVDEAPVAPVEEETVEEETVEDGVADVGVEPTVEPRRDPQADSDLYYKGRADGASAAAGGSAALPMGVGFATGCAGGCIGCTGSTLAFALIEPDVPAGSWQDEEALYQQGYLQAYRDTWQKEHARKAFIGGALGTSTLALFTLAMYAQL